MSFVSDLRRNEQTGSQHPFTASRTRSGLFQWISAGALCVTCFAATVAAVDESDAPDIQEILYLADEATRAVRAVEYDVSYYAEGEFADRVPKVQARVLARQARRGFFAHPLSIPNAEDEGPTCFRFTGTVHAPAGVSRSFDVATDGKRVVSIEMETRRYVFGDSDAMSLISQVKPLFMLEYFHPTPFHDEITSQRQRYEGVKKVGDVDCDVIYITYQRPNLDARWYFGREDHLPRRVDRIRFRDSRPVGERVLLLENLNPTPAFEADVFAPPPPPGFDQRAFTAAKRHIGNRQMTEAPDFALQSPDGTTIRLSELRGNVVVLNFWSTGSLPCKLSMPHLQTLHEKYDGMPVKIFGLNCWNEGGDPARLMRDMKLTYGLLLEADGVAREYGVESIPAVFVVTRDGKICFSQSGVVPSLERKIDRAIRRALDDADTSDESDD